MFERFAIFYTPSEAPFANFGAAWLGWDSARGTLVAHQDIQGLDMSALTATPRKYGFHATLTAPFYLASGTTKDALRAGVDAFAALHAPVSLGALALSVRGGFLSLRPKADVPQLRSLAEAVVRELDEFRAPLSEADIARRHSARLTPRQEQRLLEWGYPFVFEDFHFHMTLSGRLGRDKADGIAALAEGAVTAALPVRPTLDAITLMGQDADGMFHQLHRAALVG